RKTLANNRRRNMAAPEAGNTRHLLIFLDQRIGLPVDILDRNLNLNLAFGGAFVGRAFFGLSRAHNHLSRTAAAAEPGGKWLGCDAMCRNLECKDSRRATSNGGR